MTPHDSMDIRNIRTSLDFLENDGSVDVDWTTRILKRDIGEVEICQMNIGRDQAEETSCWTPDTNPIHLTNSL
jgi:hypothetical protein